MTKEEEFQNIAKILDKIECKAFALWYLLPEFKEISGEQMLTGKSINETVDRIVNNKRLELLKAADEIRDIIADRLW